MHKNFRILLTTLCFIVFAACVSFAQKFPEKPNRLVNDYTNTLTAEQAEQLERKLVAFDDSTSTQIAVVLINSLEGYDVADYAVRLAEQWGIGREKKNNGVLLLASLGDRRVTIQTGYGVEGALPDIIANRIIENEIKPNFKEGNYYQGLEQGTDAIIAATKGEYKNDNPKKNNKGSKFPFGLIVIIIIIIVIISRKGGGGGGGRRVIGSRGGADLFWWTLMSGMGRGNGRSGGGFGGGFGGGGGGGFGGFGGGSFGGGGSSGSW
ncbi:TPM domain-containing protein [Rubrolithibacter danxiaensis]|uniref:TPM domain-containing protein n=1 Tax=Rubrolithibacter danxiaensis TaxID=3390805 RepID=UPI003BF8C14C